MNIITGGRGGGGGSSVNTVYIITSYGLFNSPNNIYCVIVVLTEPHSSVLSWLGWFSEEPDLRPHLQETLPSLWTWLKVLKPFLHCWPWIRFACVSIVVCICKSTTEPVTSYGSEVPTNTFSSITVCIFQQCPGCHLVSGISVLSLYGGQR